MSTVPEKVFALLVVGSRSIRDYEFVSATIDKFIGPIKDTYRFLIVSGGADGVDTLADRYALKHRIDFLRFPVDWKKYDDGSGKVNKQAGYLRNREMHEFIANYEHRGCIIIHDGRSPGSLHSVSLAKEFGTPCRKVTLPEANQSTKKPYPCGLTARETDALSMWLLEQADKFQEEAEKHGYEKNDVIPKDIYFSKLSDAFRNAAVALDNLERGKHIPHDLKKYLEEN